MFKNAEMTTLAGGDIGKSMKFLKCIACGCDSVKILAILTNGSAKTKCTSCGLAWSPEKEKKEYKGPEIIYR